MKMCASFLKEKEKFGWHQDIGKKSFILNLYPNNSTDFPLMAVILPLVVNTVSLIEFKSSFAFGA